MNIRIRTPDNGSNNMLNIFLRRCGSKLHLGKPCSDGEHRRVHREEALH